MDQETVQIIVGMKVNDYRTKKGISLKDLAQQSGLSTSYINEIEKGKKFPKIEKMIQLAKGLDVPYETLTSTRLEGDLAPLNNVLHSPMIQEFPFYLFGTSARELIQLMGSHPQEMDILARMLTELGRKYDVGMDHFFHTALRCYQMIHNNFFPDLEAFADQFRKQVKLGNKDLVTHEHMRQALISGCRWKLVEKAPEELPENLRSQRCFVLPKRNELWLNRRLTSAQRGFVYARELGYHLMQVKDRSLTSPTLRVGNFAHVYDNFRASYFAGALLIPRRRFQLDLKRIFAMESWADARETLLNLTTTYGVTPETLFYRLSELIPQFFRTKNVHFTVFSKPAGATQVRLEQQLNMSQLHIPNGTGLNENFCGRWLSVTQLHVLEKHEGGGAILAAQRSKFLSFGTEFFCMTVAYRGTLRPGTLFSATVGFPLNTALKGTVKFWADDAIPFRELGQTCERCPLTPEQCVERQAPPHLYEARQARKARIASLETLLEDSGDA